MGHFHKLHARQGGQDLPRFVKDPAAAAKVAGVVVGDKQRLAVFCLFFEGEGLAGHKVGHKLAGVDQADVAKIRLPCVDLLPDLQAGGAGKDDGARLAALHFGHIVGNDFGQGVRLAGAKQREAAAPLVGAHDGEVGSGIDQDLHKGHGNLLGQGEVGPHAAREVDDVRLPAHQIARRLAHVVEPVRPLVVVLVKDVVTAFEIGPDGPDPGRGMACPGQFPAHIEPQVLQGQANRADFLAVSAQRAAEDRRAVFVQPCRIHSGCSAEGFQQILPEAVLITQKALQASQTHLGREPGVSCGSHCRADIQALAALRTGIQGQTLRETEG